MASSHPGPPPFRAVQARPKRQNFWLWCVCLGLGGFSFVGFIIAAVKVRNWKLVRAKFVRAAVISVILGVVVNAALVIWPNNGVKPEDAYSVTGVYRGPAPSVYVLGVVWAFLVLYALVLNRDYKKFVRDEAERDDRRTHAPYAQTPFHYPPATKPSAPSVPPVEHIAVQADKYLATQPTGNTPAKVPPNGPWG